MVTEARNSKKAKASFSYGLLVASILHVNGWGHGPKLESGGRSLLLHSSTDFYHSNMKMFTTLIPFLNFSWPMGLPAVERRQTCTWSCQRSIRGEGRGWQWRGRSTPRRWCQWRPGLLHKHKTTTTVSSDSSVCRRLFYRQWESILSKGLRIKDTKKHQTTITVIHRRD